MTSDNFISSNKIDALTSGEKPQAEHYRRHLEAVCNNATLALFIMDEHQQCVYMNPAAETLTGFSLEEVCGQPLHEIIHHTRPDGTPYPLDECPIDRAFPKNNQEQGEEVFVRKDGTFYPVAYTASPIREGSGIIGTIIEVRDITQEKLDEQARQELERSKANFFSNISHEFRTPLTLMLGPIEDALADVEEPLSPLQRERIEILHRNGLRLLKLVNTLLDFSQIEANRMQAFYEPIDLAQLTSELASMFRSAIERAGLSLRISCPPLPEPVYVDRDMWEKIVLNLISNAFKYTFAGEIAVILKDRGDRVELEVKDTGIGIPASDLPQIFERFYQVQGAKKRSYEGSGIGLSLVRELVSLHGGTIEAKSVVDRGTSFIVSIPLRGDRAPKPEMGTTRSSIISSAIRTKSYLQESLSWLPKENQQVDSPSAGTKNNPGGARILVADDNADMRDYLKRLLSQYYEVETVGDGITALAVARQKIPDLVLSDVMMPGLDGFDLLRSLRNGQNTKNIPIILLSARAGADFPIYGLEAGADDYLIKPFSAPELIARVKSNLNLARIRQEMARLEQEKRIEVERLLAREQAARKEAEAANRIKDEFLAVLSHELRSPLNPILGWSQLLRDNKRANETMLSKGLETIERNVKLQIQLIDDLLDISRILRGKLHLNIATVNLAFITEAALETVRLAASSKSIQIQTFIPSEAIRVEGDEARLQQIVWNLLSNAVKFTPEGGQITVRVEKFESIARIEVKDTGKGISADFLPHVFEQFRQADSTTTRKFGGLGLGLAIVRHLVELHGGTIQAESQGEGKGATFTASLPLLVANPSFLPESQNLDEFPSLGGNRILVIDDDPNTREFLAFALEQSGANITLAASGPEALAYLEQFSFNLILSDIGMPEMDGYTFIDRVRSHSRASARNTPAIALTAYASDRDRQLALNAGFQSHISKPVNLPELARQIIRIAGNLGT